SVGSARPRKQAVVRHPQFHGCVPPGTGSHRCLRIHGDDATRPDLDVSAQRQARRLHPRADSIERTGWRALLGPCVAEVDRRILRNSSPTRSQPQGRKGTPQARCPPNRSGPSLGRRPPTRMPHTVIRMVFMVFGLLSLLSPATPVSAGDATNLSIDEWEALWTKVLIRH